jgi:hypothetical protein
LDEDYHIPARFANRERMEALTNLLDDAVASGIGEKAFLGRIARSAKLESEELEEVAEVLKALYRQLRELHDEGVNGVWARIIKNSFAPLFVEPCHYIVGNPPWVNWESLPDEYRRSTMPLWEQYGLFPHGGMDTILGKGKKDISMLMTYVAVDRYLRRGGKLGFVVSQSLFKTSGAGQGFRRFLLPDKTPFGPSTVDDMTELNPFEGAANRTAVVVLIKGRAVSYPVSYSYWKKRLQGRGSGLGFDTPYEEIIKNKLTFRPWFAEPVVRTDKTSGWITARRQALRALQNVLGPSDYAAHAGSFTGGANGVYWVEVLGKRPGGLAMIANITEGAKRKVPNTQAAVEEDLIYPLLRGRDVGRWAANPSASILMMQDPEDRRGIAVEIVEDKYPKAHSYLSRFETVLRKRAAFRRYYRETDPYWSMFNVSHFTFSRWKVVWREQASTLTAAVVGPLEGRSVIPDHKLMMVAVRSAAEANFLCAALNSVPARFAVAAYAVEVQMDTHILENIAIPKYSDTNKIHQKVAALGEAAWENTAKSNQSEVAKIEQEIDDVAARLWNLSDQELTEIKRSLEEM